MHIALKIDVDTLRGTLEGVPRLVELLQTLNVDATFLFSLGPDNTGRALRRLLRPGFLKKVLRTSVASHYGLKTLCYGTLIPGPDIGKQGADAMRQVRDAGFEVGIHTWDHVRWQDFVAKRGEAWTRRDMQKALDRFQYVFGQPPATIGAAGWQMNPHAFAFEDALGFRYASDSRGTHPFIPVVDGQAFQCVQLPTTIPTLDELVGAEGITGESVASYLIDYPPAEAASAVFTLHAELEGMAYLDVFERVLRGWLERGYRLGSMHDLYQTLNVAQLPRHACVRGEVAGRSGLLAVQAAAVDRSMR